MNKISLILGVLLVIAIGVAGYFWLQTQQDPGTILGPYTPSASENPTPSPSIMKETENWETYTNQKLGYSFEYEPVANLEILGCSNDEAFKPGEDRIYFEEESSTFPACGFGGYAPPISIGIGNSICDDQDQNYNVQKIKVSVAGQETTRCIHELIGNPDGPYLKYYQTVVIASPEGTLLSLTVAKPEYLDTFGQILSTFKFIAN